MTDSAFLLLNECISGKRSDDHVFTRETISPCAGSVFSATRYAARGLVRMSVDRSEPVDAKQELPVLTQLGGNELKYSGLILDDLRRSAA